VRLPRPRLPSPGLLFAAGLVLLVAVIVAALIVRNRGGGTTPAAPPTTTTTTSVPAGTTPSTTAAPPGVSTTENGITISDARVVELTPFAATVEWTTDSATSGRLAAASGAFPPSLWSEPTASGTHHLATIGGLAFDSPYQLSMTATDEHGHEAELTLPVTMPQPSPESVVASTADGAIRLDGQPFFPLLVWGECPIVYESLLAAGINLVAENPCGGVPAQVDALAGRALSASVAGRDDAQDPRVIGWFFPDEADALGLTARSLPAVPASRPTGRISFLTLSNHFYSVTAPLAQGRAMYPGLVSTADVVGFDLYPLQVMCWADRVDSVYAAQAELERLAPGKPTFQWIEAATMNCPARGRTAITPATVRAESWLAIAAGADGLGFFPGQWTPPIAAAIRSVTEEVDAFAPALLAPRVGADAGGSALRIAAHALNDALYVVVANPVRRRVDADVHVATLADRALHPLRGGPPISAASGAFHVSLPPLGTAVYVSPPAG
jgi:hypothetical protein